MVRVDNTPVQSSKIHEEFRWFQSFLQVHTGICPLVLGASERNSCGAP